MNATLTPPPHLLVIGQAYIHEKLRRNGSNVSRPARALANMVEFFWDRDDPQKLRLADFAAYEDHRYSQGVAAPTVRREFTFFKAAMNHAHKRERIDKVPHIEMPSGDVVQERRAATEDEFRLLMREGRMSYRIRMFFRLAYYTGHRAQAIEELRWESIDWTARFIDFTNGGKQKRNKRRNAAFPIPDALMPYLEAAKARHDALAPNDPYVIGAGKRGGASCSYVECKAAWRSVGVNAEGLARHCFRKTFVTELVKAGEKVETAALLIADKPETALKYYYKLRQDDLRNAVNRR